ncbi:hypothetical protein BO83DRAFT_393443 [Aspergillus eucalypticola CBS 122712]|uniref:Uncharacterized protein n=1 Tax=Aspergillus eucalypticola (strain CBS 122712 / IBT 29274) TaxID=1448314 RepID=A0A317UPF9_ASPEC|nr:uncharacterized protein BO83DRAFT_393443 [Aspergillus eucalypticola CBS 122712]PWY63415.1 hypothetical protein BO83DRAFT_393443 [Aspergillus eucalypticola CBS 122712]
MSLLDDGNTPSLTRANEGEGQERAKSGTKWIKKNNSKLDRNAVAVPEILGMIMAWETATVIDQSNLCGCGWCIIQNSYVTSYGWPAPPSEKGLVSPACICRVLGLNALEVRSRVKDRSTIPTDACVSFKVMAFSGMRKSHGSCFIDSTRRVSPWIRRGMLDSNQNVTSIGISNREFIDSQRYLRDMNFGYVEVAGRHLRGSRRWRAFSAIKKSHLPNGSKLCYECKGCIYRWTNKVAGSDATSKRVEADKHLLTCI